MALTPSFTIDFECNFQSLTFTETTGSYNASTNTGGYGTPNIATSDVDSTELIIENLLTGITFDTITSISASSTGVEYEFELEDLLVDDAQQYTTYIQDGVYLFTYNVVDGATTYTYSVRKLILPYLWGLLATAGTTLIDSTCKCHDEYVSKWQVGFSYLTCLEGTAVCGDMDVFETQYTKVKNYLLNLQCNC